MSRVAIVGDGPGGLSAALFLAKNGHDTVVYGADQTPMHYAHLYNYLGVEDEPGAEFQRRAREQARSHGVVLNDAEVAGIERDGGAFRVVTAEGGSTADYLILAGGRTATRLAGELGVTVEDNGAVVDAEYRTNLDRVYAVGMLARPNRSQAIISAGAGATAAVDILSLEAGKDVHDWDRA